MLTDDQRLGLDDSHLVVIQSHKLEHSAAKAFAQMHAKAKSEGFDLRIASGWRSFERQLAIFNRKASGEKALQDRQGDPITEPLTDSEKLHSILVWSALPGLSRHHWGTDLDWYDGAKLKAAELHLEPWEYQQGGPCSALADWLETNMAAFGFYRPYQHDLGGVVPEPWHLSYAPIAIHQLSAINEQTVRELLSRTDIGLKDEVLEQLPILIERYALRVSQASDDSGA